MSLVADPDLPPGLAAEKIAAVTDMALSDMKDCRVGGRSHKERLGKSPPEEIVRCIGCYRRFRQGFGVAAKGA